MAINFRSPYLTGSDGRKIPCSLKIEENGSYYSVSFTLNQNVKLKEAVLFSGAHNFPAGAKFYGDGYQMLSQYSGTTARFGTITGYSDKGHYKMPQTSGFKTVYNYALIGSR